MSVSFAFKQAIWSSFCSKRLVKHRRILPRLFSNVANGNMSGKFKVLVTTSLPQEAMDILRAEKSLDIDQWDSECDVMPRGDLMKGIKGKDGLCCLITDKIDEELLKEAGSQLKVVSTVSVGYDHINTAAIKARNILLGNTPDVLTDATADLGVGLLLATSRRFFEAADAVRSGGWSSWAILWMCGSGLKNSTVGIVGLGRIGQAVCRRLAPFGPSTFLYCGNKEKKEEENPVNAEFVSMDELLSRSDFVIASCALTSKTKEMFNKDLFSKMKPTAIFINISRGGVVNQDDLYDALINGSIKAAGLDVTTPEPLPTDHKLLDLKNCVILPHIGSAETATRTVMAVLAARNLVAGLLGQKMPSQVML